MSQSIRVNEVNRCPYGLDHGISYSRKEIACGRCKRKPSVTLYRSCVIRTSNRKHLTRKEKVAGEKLPLRSQAIAVMPTEATPPIAAAKEQSLATSFLPLSLSRVCPFFPKGRKKGNERIDGTYEIENIWGRCEIFGWKLSTFDEDILYSLLSLARSSRPYQVTTNVHQICRVLGKTPSGASYDLIKNSIQRLAASGCKLTYPKKKPMRWEIESFLTQAESNGTELSVTISPFFCEMLDNKSVTFFYLRDRRKIKGDIGKAMHRFFIGQKDNGFPLKLVDLCRAINLKTDGGRRFKVRSQIKKGLEELVAKGILKHGGISKNDIIVWKKSVADKKGAPSRSDALNAEADDTDKQKAINVISECLRKNWGGQTGCRVDFSDNDIKQFRTVATKIYGFIKKHKVPVKKPGFGPRLSLQKAYAGFISKYFYPSFVNSLGSGKKPRPHWLLNDRVYDNLRHYLIEREIIPASRKKRTRYYSDAGS